MKIKVVHKETFKFWTQHFFLRKETAFEAVVHKIESFERGKNELFKSNWNPKQPTVYYFGIGRFNENSFFEHIINSKAL